MRRQRWPSADHEPSPEKEMRMSASLLSRKLKATLACVSSSQIIAAALTLFFRFAEPSRNAILIAGGPCQRASFINAARSSPVLLGIQVKHHSSGFGIGPRLYFLA